MSLPVPNLDDRSWKQIVDEAVRLIPRYCPEWTNHHAPDPRATLRGSYVWMTEMVIDRLNKGRARERVVWRGADGRNGRDAGAAVRRAFRWRSGAPRPRGSETARSRCLGGAGGRAMEAVRAGSECRRRSVGRHPGVEVLVVNY